jgi:hypothetical protein
MRLAVVTALAALVTLAACDRPSAAAGRGERLYIGDEPLAAQIHGQGVPLPGEASRCANCHGDAPARGSAGIPAIDSGALLTRTSRRNGPPSRYDARSFCALLRTGLDPALVQIPRVMPRYELTDAQCDALFAYLTES